MDLNAARTVITVLAFVSFIGIVYWAYTSRNRQRFDEAANLPFADDDVAKRSGLDQQQHKGRS